MDTVNRAPLAYWRESGYLASDLDSFGKSIDESILAARFVFPGDQTLQISVSRQVERRREGHFPTICEFVTEILNKWQQVQVRGSLFFWLEDCYWRQPLMRVPLIAYSKSVFDNLTLLIPDPAFIKSNAYQQDIAEINQKIELTPWEKRRKTVFWRGASSGCHVGYPNWEQSPRIKLCLKAKELNNPALLDASLSKIVEYDGGKEKAIAELDILGSSCPFIDFLNYRYLIDVDGWTCAWVSFFLKLVSGSVVLKVQSDQIQWYYHKLIPWEHYIPIQKDLSDLLEIIEWVQHHDERCRQIAKNARTLMLGETLEAAVAGSARLLEELLSYQRD